MHRKTWPKLQLMGKATTNQATISIHKLKTVTYLFWRILEYSHFDTTLFLGLSYPRFVFLRVFTTILSIPAARYSARNVAGGDRDRWMESLGLSQWKSLNMPLAQNLLYPAEINMDTEDPTFMQTHSHTYLCIHIYMHTYIHT